MENRKPPLGIIPRKIWIQDNLPLDSYSIKKRFNNLNAAIKRYIDNGFNPNPDWLIERELLKVALNAIKELNY